MIKAIVCVDENWSIGRDNNLLFKLPLDMKLFKDTTIGEIVVCGRKTLESFPNSKPLKDRSTICICSKENTRDDCFCVHDIELAIKLAQEMSKTRDVYIIGGSTIYKTFLPYYDEAYITKVKANGYGTVFFPNLDENDNFEQYYCSPDVEDNGYIINVCAYRKKVTDEDC